MIDVSKLRPLCEQYDIVELRVFGSFARGEETVESDVDLLAYFSRRKSLLAMVKIQHAMSQTLQRPVDLLTEASLSPYLRQQIVEESRVIYEARQ